MRAVGGFAVHPLVDVAGSIDTTHREAFPGATDQQWAAAQALDPTVVGAGGVDAAWVLPFRAYVVVGPDDSVTIVDLGVGTDSSPAASWAPGRGGDCRSAVARCRRACSGAGCGRRRAGWCACRVGWSP